MHVTNKLYQEVLISLTGYLCSLATMSASKILTATYLHMYVV